MAPGFAVYRHAALLEIAEYLRELFLVERLNLFEGGSIFINSIFEVQSCSCEVSSFRKIGEIIKYFPERQLINVVIFRIFFQRVQEGPDFRKARLLQIVRQCCTES